MYLFVFFKVVLAPSSVPGTAKRDIKRDIVPALRAPSVMRTSATMRNFNLTGSAGGILDAVEPRKGFP